MQMHTSTLRSTNWQTCDECDTLTTTAYTYHCPQCRWKGHLNTLRPAKPQEIRRALRQLRGESHMSLLSWEAELGRYLVGCAVVFGLGLLALLLLR